MDQDADEIPELCSMDVVAEVTWTSWRTGGTGGGRGFVRAIRAVGFGRAAMLHRRDPGRVAGKTSRRRSFHCGAGSAATHDETAAIAELRALAALNTTTKT